MDEYGLTRPRPISSTPPIGSPTFSGFLDNIATSYRSANQLRPSSPVGIKQVNKSSDEQPLLKRYKVDFSPDEPITHLVASNKQVVIATKDKKILLIDTNTNEQSICDIGRYFGSRLAQIKIYKIFLDPSGKFLLISVAYAADNQPCENLLYVKQIQQLQRLKNHLISSVAWNHSKQNTAAQSSSGTLSTGTILLGTTKGLVLQTEFTQSDETKFFPLKSGPGHYVKEIFDVGPDLGSITGISCHQINSSSSTERSFVILLSTNNRLYRMVGNVPAFIDPPPLQQIMAANANSFKDVSGRVVTGSKLDLYYPSKANQQQHNLPSRYAWITEPGVITSELYEQVVECRTSFESELNFIKYNDPDESCLPPSLGTPSGISPQFGGGLSYYDKPISMVVSNFHVIILMRHCLRAICILNSRIVHQEYFLADHGEALGMGKDPIKNIIYVYFKRVIFRYKMSNENKDVWKIFLDLKRFDLARRYSTGENHDRVICEEAQHYFILKDYEKSAEIFASSKKPFEDACLMFIGTKCKSALRKYLTIRLSKFESDSIQFYMLLSWLLSLIVADISILEVGPVNEKADSELEVLYQELDQLLDDDQVIDCLKFQVDSLYSIIQCYGHRKIEIMVANRIQDYNHLLQLHMDRCEYDEALAILRAAKQPRLLYLHGHLLMKHKPKELVDAMIEQPNLDPSRLIGILEQERSCNEKRTETIRYLEYCVNTLRTDHKSIHVRLFELYARNRPESHLMDLLESEPCYLDLRKCLKICVELKLVRTLTEIYSRLGLYANAVRVALEFDIQLAKSIANRAESEEDQRRLWLAIAKKVLTEEGATIQMAAELLDESRLLRLEDVLVFFPDCRTIDPIKGAVIRALQEKQNKLMAIRDGEYEIIANRIRGEIKTFKARYSKLRCGQKCDICAQNIMSRTHYLFPCGHLFHYDCILKEITAIDPQHKDIEDKLKQLAIVESKPLGSAAAAKQQAFTLNSFSSQSNKTSSASGQLSQQPTLYSVPDKEKLSRDLYNITSSECIHCGSLLASIIDKPPPSSAITDSSIES